MSAINAIADKQNPRLDAAIAAVAAACEITRRVQRQPHPIAHHIKPDQSPVTIADLAAQAVIVHRLTAALGTIDLAGEEDAESLRAAHNTDLRQAVHEAVLPVWPEAEAVDVLDAIDQGSHKADTESYWTLDPIDGTKGFLRGKHYAIALAYIEAGKVSLGVLGCPNLSHPYNPDDDETDPGGLIAYAVRGQGAFMRPARGTDASAYALAPLAYFGTETLRVCESREPMHSRRDTAAQILGAIDLPQTFVAIDSQCKYAVLAGGDADLYMRIPTTYHPVEYIWDHAAGSIVASEAGAVVTDLRGHPLDFSHGTRLVRNHGILCARPGLHERVLAAIKKLGIA